MHDLQRPSFGIDFCNFVHQIQSYQALLWGYCFSTSLLHADNKDTSSEDDLSNDMDCSDRGSKVRSLYINSAILAEKSPFFMKVSIYEFLYFFTLYSSIFNGAKFKFLNLLNL